MKANDAKGSGDYMPHEPCQRLCLVLELLGIHWVRGVDENSFWVVEGLRKDLEMGGNNLAKGAGVDIGWLRREISKITVPTQQ